MIRLNTLFIQFATTFWQQHLGDFVPTWSNAMAYEWHTAFKDNSCAFSFHAFEALSMSFNAICILDVQETRKLKFRLKKKKDFCLGSKTTWFGLREKVKNVTLMLTYRCKLNKSTGHKPRSPGSKSFVCLTHHPPPKTTPWADFLALYIMSPVSVTFKAKFT